MMRASSGAAHRRHSLPARIARRCAPAAWPMGNEAAPFQLVLHHIRSNAHELASPLDNPRIGKRVPESPHGVAPAGTGHEPRDRAGKSPQEALELVSSLGPQQEVQVVAGVGKLVDPNPRTHGEHAHRRSNFGVRVCATKRPCPSGAGGAEHAMHRAPRVDGADPLATAHCQRAAVLAASIGSWPRNHQSRKAQLTADRDARSRLHIQNMCPICR